ncbi:hypothetical protein [Lysobacter capsici]|uniref:hypothetical protein n=1 Tax=Lysobacter capsici TaxID=435897 RepID=UPI000627E069|nr:hypothetical protein [Lysobacter capsici]
MSHEFRPLIEVLRELNALVQIEASGFVFLVTEELHSGIIRLHNGQVKEVTFRMLRNDEAVQGLSMVSTAKLRFQPNDIPSYGNKMALNPASMKWLLGGFEQELAGRSETTAAIAAASARAPAPPPPATARVDKRVRDTIEQVAVNYLGPIAGMLCQEAFETRHDPRQVVAHLATYLNSPQESRRFVDDAHKALDMLR